MEQDFGVDVPEVLAVVNTAEVFVVMFPHFERRLLVDTRATTNEPPLIRVVARVRNADERFRELRRLRPRFAPPERIIAFQWPKSVRVLVAAGIWEAIEARVQSLGAAAATCAAVLAELQKEELTEETKAARGEEPYRTIWAAGSTS